MFLPRLALTLHIEMETALYLIPVMLSDEPLDKVLPAYNLQIVKEIKYFIVENVRSARRFLKKCDRTIDIDSLTFYTLDEHTRPEEIGDYLNPLIEGNAMGVISEAGCPAIADPGADGSTPRAEGGAFGRAVEHIAVADGFGIQRTEFCISRLSPYRCCKTAEKTARDGTQRRCRTNADFHRDALPQQQTGG